MAFHLKHHHPEKQHFVTASKWQARVTRGAKMVRERAMAPDGGPINAQFFCPGS